MLAACLLIAAVWIEAPHHVGASSRPRARAELQGPASDFWARVKRDWDRRIPGLSRGPLQTALWVPLIWGGPDRLALDEIADQIQEREARRWVRCGITKHRWSEISPRDLTRMQALRQNIILLGTPEENALIARALEATPVRVGPSSVSIGDRRMEGEDLLVVAIAPNPVHPRFYALVLTGTSAEALREIGAVPYGETDFVVHRGRKELERGDFEWDGGTPRKDRVVVVRSFLDHFNWRTRQTRHWRLHYDPALIREADLDRLGQQMEAELGETAAFYGLRPGAISPIDCYLYVSQEEKARQTGDTRTAHLETASNAVHVLFDPSRPVFSIDPSLPARVLLRRAPDLWGERAELELPGLAMAASLASREAFQTIALPVWSARSTRDTGYLPMDLLLSRTPRPPDTGDFSILDAAAFVRDLIQREGVDRVSLFYRTARRSDFRGRFQELFGLSLKQAEARWLGALPGPPAAVRNRSERQRVDEAPGSEPTSGGAAWLARDHFRAGRFAEAAGAARDALGASGGTPADRAWAHLALGRVHAVTGRRAAAVVELKDPEITQGPEVVRVLADYWMETMGQPLNRRVAHEILKQEAAADLMTFDWNEAERKLRSLLAADPQDKEAHASLGQVYLSRYQYFFDWMLLDRELFPGFSQADPEVFRHYADKGREELRLAAAIPSDEGPLSPDIAVPDTHMTEPAAPHFLLGRAHFLRGQMRSAQREMETALALHPTSASLEAHCRLYLGKIAALRGDREEARAQFKTVVKMAPSGGLTKLAREALGKL